MRVSFKKGLGFGLASGIITTLGMIVGLDSSTHSKIVVIGGILMIAVADALSDSLGIHLSEETGLKNSRKKIWESTAATFFSKLFFALTFIVPVLLFSLSTAILISIIWGLSLITIFSYYLARQRGIRPQYAILEHLAIAIIVIVATYYIGNWIATLG